MKKIVIVVMVGICLTFLITAGYPQSGYANEICGCVTRLGILEIRNCNSNCLRGQTPISWFSVQQDSIYVKNVAFTGTAPNGLYVAFGNCDGDDILLSCGAWCTKGDLMSVEEYPYGLCLDDTPCNGVQYEYAANKAGACSAQCDGIEGNVTVVSLACMPR